MYGVYTHENELVEFYASLHEAVLTTVGHWHECDAPCAFIIRDQDDIIAACISPVLADGAVVVYHDGQTATFSKIEYVREGDAITHTSFEINGMPGRYDF